MEEQEIKKNKKKKSAKKKIKAKKRKGVFLKILPVLIAVLLIVIVGGAFYGQKLLEKYSYGTDRADLNEYFATENGKLSVILNAEKMAEKAKLIDGKPYFSADFVKEHFTDHFFISEKESSVLYTTATETVKCMIGDDFKYYLTKDEKVDVDYAPVVKEGKGEDTKIYFALEYVKLFTAIKYDVYADPGYILIYTTTPAGNSATMTVDSAVREKGGIKSPILDDLAKGEEIFILEEMEDWAKVIDARGYIGYVEIKQYEVTDAVTDMMAGVTVSIPLEYTSLTFDGKINMAFHQVFADPATHFTNDTASVKSVNVMAPTLFRVVIGDTGAVEIKALPAAQYVERAHEKGMKVWAVWTDVDYDVDIDAIMESSTLRNQLIEEMITRTKENGIDGINIDFEKVSSDGGEAFIQFLRELSIETHKEGIFLSVDNYALASVTGFYNRKEQGNVVDYVIIMGYDEHWASSNTAGSVASINYVERGIRETLDEVPAEKVINAVPFYTRIWRTNDEGKVGSDTISMITQAEWIAQVGITPVWDNETCQNYGEAVVGGKTCQIWMEDAESLKVKLNIMEKYKLAGVAEWKIGMETPDVWDVFEQYMAGALGSEE